jgi:hypothetical protein
MATQVRNTMLDAPVNPAILPGLKEYCGRVTLDNTKTATITVPAKSVIIAYATVGTGIITPTESTDGNMVTFTFTATADGTLQYMIKVTETETITHPDAGTSDIVLTSK